MKLFVNAMEHWVDVVSIYTLDYDAWANGDKLYAAGGHHNSRTYGHPYN